MPYVTRPRWARRALATTILALAGFGAVPALAAADCPSASTSKPFSRFGDFANYSLLSGGSFESGASGWALSKASVVAGNETYYVGGSTNAKSLAMSADGLVTSPAFCVSIAHPTFRFFARRTSGSWGVLYASLLWTDSSGHTNKTVVGALSGDGYLTWQPTPALPLSTTLPLWMPGSTLSVRIVLDAEDYGGSWAVDDVYIDPYSR